MDTSHCLTTLTKILELHERERQVLVQALNAFRILLPDILFALQEATVFIDENERSKAAHRCLKELYLEFDALERFGCLPAVIRYPIPTQPS